MEISIPIIRGVLPDVNQRENQERMKYESGEADKDASAISGRHDEPWMNVLDAYEPGSPVAVQHIINDNQFNTKLKGRILDLGAGTCWLTATLSKRESVDEVVALDLSENFLRSVGARIINQMEGDHKKIKFAVSTFNDVPFEDDYFDCVFMVACIHHSLAPIKTLLEAKRVLKINGTLFIIESPSATLNIRKARQQSIELSQSTRATEIAYTNLELEYLIKFAGFEDVNFTPTGSFSKNPIKKIIRKMLRHLSIEEFMLSATYIISARKSASSW